MRNQEAARYARWAAMVAAGIALLVVGVYVHRAIRVVRARRTAPALVPSTVQQQSANFSYSDVEQGRTVFTIRASHATQFKDQNRALLQNVWISVYGREGNRNDNVHARECNYEPATGGIFCKGAVEIDIQNATLPAAESTGDTLRVNTRDLAFNRQTGEASTEARVDFSFPQGQGRGVGMSYNTQDSTVRLTHSVEFSLAPSDHTGGQQVTAAGSSLEIRRDERLAILGGPAAVRQGSGELLAGRISIYLDDSNRPQSLIAEDHPLVRRAEDGAKFAISAYRLAVALTQEGAIAKLSAEGKVLGTRNDASGTERFSAEHVNLVMSPESNLVRQMIAMGEVAAESHKGSDSHLLKTDALQVLFATEHATRSANHSSTKVQPSSLFSLNEQQRIETVETLTPGTIQSKTGNEITQLDAKKFVAQFNEAGGLEKLLGHADVHVRRQVANGVPQVSSATELVATFGPNGQWASLDERGNVHFQEADRQANAAHATVSRSTGLISLEGSPVLSDAVSRTLAGAVEINQQSGEIRASAGIVSTYVPPARGTTAVNFGTGPAHISADSFSGNSMSGHAIYRGHARLWQGESVLDSDQIEIWRDEKKLEARGQVVAIFAQAPGAGLSFPAALPASQPASTAAAAKSTLWQVRAPSLTYWGDQQRAHLDDGVTATSDQSSLQSRTLDIFLGSGPSASSGNAGAIPTSGSQVTRVLARGDVIVRQAGRKGSSEQAEYTAADQKFVLSGGHPTLADAASDTTTGGRSLTFFVASDTILIDSQQGLRTLTKHRVEK